MSKTINNRLENDGNGSPIPTGSTFQTYDATGTAILSPITLADAAKKNILFPTNAAEITIYSDQNLSLGVTEDSVDVAGGDDDFGYTLIPSEIFIVKGISKMDGLWLKNNSGSSATIYFDFTMI